MSIKDYSNYDRYIRLVNGQVNVKLEISEDSVIYINKFIKRLSKKIITSSLNLLKDANENTIDKRHILFGIQLIVPKNEIFKINNFALKALKVYKGTDIGESKSKRSGLLFSPSRFKNEIKVQVNLRNPSIKVTDGASIYLTSAIEKIIRDLLLAVGVEAKSNNQKRINVYNIKEVLSTNENLKYINSHLLNVPESVGVQLKPDQVEFPIESVVDKLASTGTLDMEESEINPDYVPVIDPLEADPLEDDDLEESNENTIENVLSSVKKSKVPYKAMSSDNAESKIRRTVNVLQNSGGNLRNKCIPKNSIEHAFLLAAGLLNPNNNCVQLKNGIIQQLGYIIDDPIQLDLLVRKCEGQQYKVADKIYGDSLIESPDEFNRGLNELAQSKQYQIESAESNVDDLIGNINELDEENQKIQQMDTEEQRVYINDNHPEFSEEPPKKFINFLSKKSNVMRENLEDFQTNEKNLKDEYNVLLKQAREIKQSDIDKIKKKLQNELDNNVYTAVMDTTKQFNKMRQEVDKISRALSINSLDFEFERALKPGLFKKFDEESMHKLINEEVIKRVEARRIMDKRNESERLTRQRAALYKEQEQKRKEEEEEYRQDRKQHRQVRFQTDRPTDRQTGYPSYSTGYPY